MKTLCELQWLNKGAPLWANAGQPECATFASVTLKRAGLAGWHWLYCVWQAAIIVLAIHNCCAYLDYNVLCAGKKGTQLQSHCRDEEERKNNLSWDKNVISFEDSSLSLSLKIYTSTFNSTVQYKSCVGYIMLNKKIYYTGCTKCTITSFTLQALIKTVQNWETTTLSLTFQKINIVV